MEGQARTTGKCFVDPEELKAKTVQEKGNLFFRYVRIIRI